MPRSPQQNQTLRDTRRRTILDAALRVYVAHGYHGAEIAEVARRSSSAAGLVHYYFGNKRDLFRALFLALCGQARAYNEQLAAVELPAASWVDHVVGSYLQASVWAPDNVRFFARSTHDVPALEDAEVEAAHAAAGSDMLARMAQRLGEAMELGQIPAGHPDLLAALVWSAIDGGMRYLIDAPGDHPTKLALADEIRRHVRGLVRGGETTP